MKITWIGHSSFLIEDSHGIKLLTDPFDPSIGYSIYEGDADIVTISHYHFDHDYIKGVKGNPIICDKVGDFNYCGITINGLPTFHDKVRGSKRGENIVYIWEMDGFRLCHLGDLGHTLLAEDIDKIGKIDVLFIPVGGNFTLDSSEASNVAKDIKSHIIIPMHYKTPLLSFPLAGVEDFLTEIKNGENINSSSLVITEKLEGYDKVKLFKVFKISNL